MCATGGTRMYWMCVAMLCNAVWRGVPKCVRGIFACMHACMYCVHVMQVCMYFAHACMYACKVICCSVCLCAGISCHAVWRDACHACMWVCMCVVFAVRACVYSCMCAYL